MFYHCAYVIIIYHIPSLFFMKYHTTLINIITKKLLNSSLFDKGLWHNRLLRSFKIFNMSQYSGIPISLLSDHKMI